MGNEMLDLPLSIIRAIFSAIGSIVTPLIAWLLLVGIVVILALIVLLPVFAVIYRLFHPTYDRFMYSRDGMRKITAETVYPSVEDARRTAYMTIRGELRGVPCGYSPQAYQAVSQWAKLSLDLHWPAVFNNLEAADEMVSAMIEDVSKNMPEWKYGSSVRGIHKRLVSLGVHINKIMVVVVQQHLSELKSLEEAIDLYEETDRYKYEMRKLIEKAIRRLALERISNAQTAKAVEEVYSMAYKYRDVPYFYHLTEAAYGQFRRFFKRYEEAVSKFTTMLEDLGESEDDIVNETMWVACGV